MKSLETAFEIFLAAVCLISALAFAIAGDYGATIWAFVAGIGQMRFVAFHLKNR